MLKKRKNIRKKVDRIFAKVVKENYSQSIFYELSYIPDYWLYTSEERKEKCPTFPDLNMEEFKIMCAELKMMFVGRLSHGPVTFLQSYRIMLALELSMLYPLEKIRSKNLNIKICKKFYPLNESEQVKMSKFKDFELLDQI